MSDNPIKDYSAAIEELENVEGEVHEITSVVQYVGQQLVGHPDRFWIANAGVDFPIGVSIPGNPNITAEEWPSINKLTETILAFHRKRQAVEYTWKLLPTDDKKKVRPPEWLR